MESRNRNYGDEWRDSDLSGYYARDPHRGGFGDDYAREGRMLSYRGRGPKNYRRSDERIAEDIHRILTDDDHLDASDIDVRVDNGEVTLTGNVANSWAKRYGEDLVALCNGVHDVQNRLQVAAIESQRLGKTSE